MRQFIESLLLFQFITGRYSPVVKVKSKPMRVAIYGGIFLTLFIFQIYNFTQNKELNLYELLELESPYVSDHAIDVAFDQAKTKYNPLEEPAHQKRFDKIIKSQKCLKRARCRDQYTRYNLAIDLPDDPNVEIDWRLGFTIIFYVLFAFTQSSLGSKEQKPGIRVAMGLGIMFCIDEIMVLQDISTFIKEGQKSDPSIQRMLSMFPQSYCTFEVIMLARIIYFFLFSIICSISVTYILDDEKERVEKSEEMRLNQAQLTKLSKQIYQEITGKEMPATSAETFKKEYLWVKKAALYDMSMEIKAIKSGETKEVLEKKTRTWTQKITGYSSLMVVVGMILRFGYTSYVKYQAGESVGMEDVGEVFT